MFQMLRGMMRLWPWPKACLVKFLICVLGTPSVSSRQTRLMIINHDWWMETLWRSRRPCIRKVGRRLSKITDLRVPGIVYNSSLGRAGRHQSPWRLSVILLVALALYGRTQISTLTLILVYRKLEPWRPERWWILHPQVRSLRWSTWERWGAGEAPPTGTGENLTST